MTTPALKQVSPYILGLLMTAEAIANNKDTGRTLNTDETNALRERGFISHQSIYLRQEGKEILDCYLGNRFTAVYMGEGICKRIGKYYGLGGAGYELEPGRDMLLGAMVWENPDLEYLGVDTRGCEHDGHLAAITMYDVDPPKYVSYDGYIYTHKETHRRSDSEIELDNGEYEIVEGHVLHIYVHDNEEWLHGFGVFSTKEDLNHLYIEMYYATVLASPESRPESPRGPIETSKIKDALAFLATTYKNLKPFFERDLASPESKSTIIWTRFYPSCEDAFTWEHLYDVCIFWLEEFYRANQDCNLMDDPKNFGVRYDDVHQATHLVMLACTTYGIRPDK